MRVLLIEDDRMIGEGLVKALTDAGYSVDWARNGEDAAMVIAEPGYVVVLLDLNLTGLDGSTLLKRARASGVTTPILILTALDDIDDRVAALGLGADDYLCKPFELRELQARMRALIRRGAGQASARLSAGLTELNTETRELTRGAMSHVLPPREFALMLALMERPGRVLSRKEIEERLYGWGEEIESGAVEYLIHSVRGRFEKSIIVNVRALGWMVAKS